MSAGSKQPFGDHLQDKLMLTQKSDDNIRGPLKTLLDAILHKVSFSKVDCWQFEPDSIERALHGYSSKSSKYFRFLPAFTGRSLSPELYDRSIQYLGLTDKFFRLRSTEDDLDESPPWYQTVNMLVGVEIKKDGQEGITSILIFQALPGRAVEITQKSMVDSGFVALPIIDYFSLNGNNVPEFEAITAILHIACTELKAIGVEMVLCFARVRDAICGGRRSYPSTISKFVLERLGFVATEKCEDIVEAEIYSQLEHCQRKFYRDQEFPLLSISFTLDLRETQMKRYLPVASHDGSPLFDWDGKSLVWLEHLK